MRGGRSSSTEGGWRTMGLRELIYNVYERRLLAALPKDRIPRHVGVIIDGNRRWAREAGKPLQGGYRRGAAKYHDVVEWCDQVGVEVVTLWLLSTDNLSRPKDQIEPLLRIIEEMVRDLAASKRWRVHPVGAPDLLPSATASVVKEADEATVGNTGMLINVAVGYGGRREIADAVRSLLQDHASRGTTIEELAEILDVEHIAEHLYTRGQPDPDLVIRTSGEQRLSGFLLWQSAHTELYFCEAYGPDFRRVDFLRALRDYAARHRRFGS